MLAARADAGVQQTLLQRLSAARAQTDKLFALVSPDALYDRPIPERHRIVFYIGHLEAFDWNLLHSFFPNGRSFDAGLDPLLYFRGRYRRLHFD